MLPPLSFVHIPTRLCLLTVLFRLVVRTFLLWKSNLILVANLILFFYQFFFFFKLTPISIICEFGVLELPERTNLRHRSGKLPLKKKNVWIITEDLMIVWMKSVDVMNADERNTCTLRPWFAYVEFVLFIVLTPQSQFASHKWRGGGSIFAKTWNCHHVRTFLLYRLSYVTPKKHRPS